MFFISTKQKTKHIQALTNRQEQSETVTLFYIGVFGAHLLNSFKIFAV